MGAGIFPQLSSQRVDACTLAYLAAGKLLWRGGKNAFTLPIRLLPCPPSYRGPGGLSVSGGQGESLLGPPWPKGRTRQRAEHKGFWLRYQVRS
jgi:hypothetical protein